MRREKLFEITKKEILVRAERHRWIDGSIAEPLAVFFIFRKSKSLDIHGQEEFFGSESSEAASAHLGRYLTLDTKKM
jgi:hypothetical protein